MNGAGPTEKLEDRHRNMQHLPPKSAVIPAHVESISRHAMSIGIAQTKLLCMLFIRRPFYDRILLVVSCTMYVM